MNSESDGSDLADRARSIYVACFDLYARTMAIDPDLAADAASKEYASMRNAIDGAVAREIAGGAIEVADLEATVETAVRIAQELLYQLVRAEAVLRHGIR